MSRSWVEVFLPRIRANVAAIRRRIGEKPDIIAVVKANAYGHGAARVAACLRSGGVSSFATATVDEALEVREAVPDAQILVLMGCEIGQEAVFQTNRLTVSVFDLGPVPRHVPIEVKIDSGMGRLGIPLAAARSFLRPLVPQLRGTFSHFASSESDEDYSMMQLQAFLAVTEGFAARRHVANSGGLRFPAAYLDAVRPGLALYGISPCAEVADVEPALAWNTRILAVREFDPGQTLGYGRTFTASRTSRIAVLPVGYADGYNRRLSNRGRVRIRGVLAPVVGMVSMDLTTVDVTDIPGVSIGDQAALLEADAASPISAAALARELGTIPYEVLTSIGNRVARVYET